MTVRIALMRHGVTAWNRAHRIQGRTDIPLDATGILDLQSRELPDEWRFAEIWSSPLMRARQTAQILGQVDPKVSDALIEQDWGVWEGQYGAELRADAISGFRDIEDWGWDYYPPEGESPKQIRSRLLPWMNDLTRDTVAVCHMGTMRVALALAHGWNFCGPCPFAIKRNRLYVLRREGESWRAQPESIPLRKVDL